MRIFERLRERRSIAACEPDAHDRDTVAVRYEHDAPKNEDRANCGAVDDR